MLAKLLFLILFVLISSGCVTIKESTACSVAGSLSGGGICANMISSKTWNLTFDEFLDFISAQPERECVPVPNMNVCASDQSHGERVMLPARAAAIIMSADDWTTKKTELEIACRELGSRCSYETLQVLKSLK